MEPYLNQIDHGNKHLLKIDLNNDVVVVGLDYFPELRRYPHVSSQHAKFTKKNSSEWYVEDLGSSHGTYVNGFRIEKQVVSIGDHIGFGVKRVNKGFLCSISARPIKDDKKETLDISHSIKQEPSDPLTYEEPLSKKIKLETLDEPEIVFLGEERVTNRQLSSNRNKVKEIQSFHEFTATECKSSDLLIKEEKAPDKIIQCQPLDHPTQENNLVKTVKCEPSDEQNIIASYGLSSTLNEPVKTGIHNALDISAIKSEPIWRFATENSPCEKNQQEPSSELSTNVTECDQLNQRGSLSKVVNCAASKQVTNSRKGDSSVKKTVPPPNQNLDVSSPNSNPFNAWDQNLQPPSSTSENNAYSSCVSDQDDVLVLPKVDKKGYSCTEEVIDISDDETSNTSSSVMRNCQRNKLGDLSNEELLEILRTIDFSKIISQTKSRTEDCPNVSVNPVSSSHGEVQTNVPVDPGINSSAKSCSNVLVNNVSSSHDEDRTNVPVNPVINSTGKSCSNVLVNTVSNSHGEVRTNVSVNPVINSSGKSCSNVLVNPISKSSDESRLNVAVDPVLNSRNKNSLTVAPSFERNEEHSNLGSKSGSSLNIEKFYSNQTGAVDDNSVNSPHFNDDHSNSSVSSHDDVIYPSFVGKNQIECDNSQEISKSKSNNISGKLIVKKKSGDNSKSKPRIDKQCDKNDYKTIQNKLPSKKDNHPQKKIRKQNHTESYPPNKARGEYYSNSRREKVPVKEKISKPCESIIIKGSTEERNALASYKIPKVKPNISGPVQETHTEKKTPVVCKQSSSRSKFLLSDVENKSKLGEKSSLNSDTKKTNKAKDGKAKDIVSIPNFGNVKNVSVQSTSKTKLQIPAQSTNQILLPNVSQSTKKTVKIASKTIPHIPCQSIDRSLPQSNPLTCTIQSTNANTPQISEISNEQKVFCQKDLNQLPHSNDVSTFQNDTKISDTNGKVNNRYQYRESKNFIANTTSIAPIKADIFHDHTRRSLSTHCNYTSPATVHQIPVTKDYELPKENQIVTNTFVFDYEHKPPENMLVGFQYTVDYNHQSPSISSTSSPTETSVLEHNPIITREHLIQRIVELNYLWLREQDLMDQPPEAVCLGVKRLPLFFNSFKEYGSSFFPLLMLEVWETLYQASKPLWETASNRFNFMIHSCECKLPMTVYHCGALICKDSFSPEEGNVVLMEIESETLETRQKNVILGYIYFAHIQEVKKCTLNTLNGTIGKLWRFSVLVKTRNFTPKLDKVFEAKGICSIKKYVNLISALRNFAYSPLLEMILSPDLNSVYTIPLKASMSMSSRNSVIEKIMKEIQIPRPRVVLIEAAPGPDKIQFLVSFLRNLLLIPGLNHRIMLTVSSSAAVNEIAHGLMRINKHISRGEQFIKFVLVGCSNEVSSKFQLYTLDHFRNIQTEAEVRYRKNEAYFKERLEQQFVYKDDADILKEFSLVLTTLESFNNYDFTHVFKFSSSERFSCCIVDEASHCTELELLLGLCNTEKLILIGDLQRKHVTVRSKMARNHKFDQSMFERFMEFL